MKAEAHRKAWQLVGMEATLETPQAVPLTTVLPGLQMNVQFQHKGCDLGGCMGPAATLRTAHPEGWTPTVGQATPALPRPA